MDKEKIVDPALYDKNYYLTDNEGYQEYHAGFDQRLHHKYERALGLANVKSGYAVLDVGCGRGELVYHCVKLGATAVGIDYSPDAIDIARGTLERLPEDLRSKAKVDLGDVVEYAFDGSFDRVFMIDIVEHMYDWQLSAAFAKIHSILKPGGQLIITTPNDYYESILFPAKRVINIPFNFIKWGGRIARGKYRPSGFNEYWKKCVRVRINRESIAATHVNVLTPPKLRQLLSAFKADIRCEDHSVNPLSLATKKWWGREIVVVATKVG